MKCECIERVNAAIKASHGPEACLKLATFVVTHCEEKEFKVESGFPPLLFSYVKNKKRKTGNIPLNFCPVCGKAESCREIPKPKGDR